MANSRPEITDVFVLEFGNRGIQMQLAEDEEAANLPNHVKALARSVRTLTRALHVAKSDPLQRFANEDLESALHGIECISALAVEISERIQSDG